MVNTSIYISILEVLLIVLPILLSVACLTTVAERKTMASMQRRLGPNSTGYYGLLQAFADALRFIKGICSSYTGKINFIFWAHKTLTFSLFGYAVVPYGLQFGIWDSNLGILYILAVSTLSTYGILLAGWSANSKYAFLGS